MAKQAENANSHNSDMSRLPSREKDPSVDTVTRHFRLEKPLNAKVPNFWPQQSNLLLYFLLCFVHVSVYKEQIIKRKCQK